MYTQGYELINPLCPTSFIVKCPVFFRAFQRREILAKLGKAEEKRQHIGWELSVATEKIADRSRRMGVAKAAWGEWCTTKGNAWDT